MKTIACLLLSLLVCGIAQAQSPEALDLALPRSASPAADPPGTYYGDLSRRPARTAQARSTPRNACGTPVQQDDGKPVVSGSVTTGIGYTQGRGSSRWNAAHLNLCKSSYSDDGGERAFELDIHLNRYDGPGFYGNRAHPGIWP